MRVVCAIKTFQLLLGAGRIFEPALRCLCSVKHIFSSHSRMPRTRNASIIWTGRYRSGCVYCSSIGLEEFTVPVSRLYLWQIYQSLCFCISGPYFPSFFLYVFKIFYQFVRYAGSSFFLPSRISMFANVIMWHVEWAFSIRIHDIFFVFGKTTCLATLISSFHLSQIFYPLICGR